MKLFLSAFLLSSAWNLFASAPALAQARRTAGSVAMLAEPKSPADENALRDAIGDADPSVRAVAARVAGLLTRKDLGPSLQALLGREQDLTAAREQVRALLYLGGPSVLQDAKQAALRLGPAVGSVLAEIVGRTQPGSFLAITEELLRAAPEADTAVFGHVAAMVILQAPAARDGIVRSFANGASGLAWREFLTRARPGVDGLVLRAGATSARPAVREATIWFVVSDFDGVSEMKSVDLMSALRPAGAGSPEDETPWATLGRELLARRYQRSEPIDQSATIGHAKGSDAHLQELGRVPELTKAEKAALSQLLPNVGFSPERPLAAPGLPKRRNGPATRTFAAMAPGFMTSLLAAAGCKGTPRNDPFGAARIAYHADGRPRAISLDTTTLQAACATFVKFLAMLTVAPPNEPVLEAESQWFFIPIDDAVLTCADEAVPSSWTPNRARRVGGAITVPTKIRDLRPVYPETMRLARVAGEVVLQSTITASGCTTDTEVLRSVQLPLDIAALRSVSGWQFRPTLLDGVAVPVIMTVTVNFTLR